MNVRPKYVVYVSIAAALAGAVFFVAYRKSQLVKNETIPAIEFAIIEADINGLRYGKMANEGESFQFTYDLDAVSHLPVQDSKAPPEEISTKSHITGRFDLVPVADGKSFFVTGIISDFSFASTSPVASWREGLVDLLRAGILIERDETGLIKSARTEVKPDSIAMNTVRDIFMNTQLVFPKSGAAPRGLWEVGESDLNGLYTAKYGLTSAPKPTQLQIGKMRRTYFDSDATGETGGQIITPEGSANFEWNLNDGRLLSARVDYVTNVSLGDKDLSEAHTMITLLSVPPLTKGNPKVVEQKQFSHTTPWTADDQHAAEEIQMALLDLGKTTFEELLADLRKYEGTASGSKDDISAVESGRIVVKLYAYLILHPEAAQEFADLITTSKPNSMRFTYLLGALYQTEIPTSQAALVGLLQQGQGDPMRLERYLTVVSFMRKPSMEILQTLHSTLDKNQYVDSRSMAALAYGSVGRAVGARTPEIREEISKDLARRLKSNDGKISKNTTILSLGNLGGEAAADYVISQSSSPLTDTREAVAMALRRPENGPRAAGALVGMLTKDSEESVRYQASKAMLTAYRTQEGIDSQIGVLNVEKSERIREQILRNLWAVHKIFPNVISIVEKISESDPSHEVREVAKALLTDVPTP